MTQTLPYNARNVLSERSWTLLGLCAGLAAFVWCLAINWRFFHNDAYIGLRYVRNLITSGELTWNLGERVEGYTNLLHLLSVSILGLLGVELTAAAILVNALSVCLLAAAFAVGARRLADGPASTLAQGVGWLSLLAAWPLAVWVLGGLETVMLTAWVCLAHVILVPLLEGKSVAPRRATLLAGVALAAAGLTRPDGYLFVASTGMVLLLMARAAPRMRLQLFGWLILVPSLALTLHLAWRVYYYEALVPNTFHAKVGVALGERLYLGLAYLYNASLTLPTLWVAVGLTLVGLATVLRSPAALCLIASGALHGIYVVWAGGDHMPGGRFLLPTLPLAALLIVFVLAQADYGRRARNAIAAIAAVAIMAGVVRTPNLPMDPAAFVGTIVGQHISAAWPEGSLVATNSAGATPYFAPRLRFIDMLGLNDPVIAQRDIEEEDLQLSMQRLPGHAKGDGEYVLSRQPDYIIVGPTEGRDVTEPWFLSDLELATLPEFYHCYRLVEETIHYDDDFARLGPERPQPLIFTYYRRTCLRTVPITG